MLSDADFYTNTSPTIKRQLLEITKHRVYLDVELATIPTEFRYIHINRLINNMKLTLLDTIKHLIVVEKTGGVPNYSETYTATISLPLIKDEVIKSLEDVIKSLEENKLLLNDKYSTACLYIAKLEDIIDLSNIPWYKKLWRYIT